MKARVKENNLVMIFLTICLLLLSACELPTLVKGVQEVFADSEKKLLL